MLVSHLVRRAAALVVVTTAFLSAQDLRLTYLGEGVNNELGRSIAGGLDVDGDGRPDWISGARGFSTSTFAGKAHVYSGIGSLLHTFVGLAAGDEFGVSVLLVPDLNGDGRAEVVVGSRYGNGLAGNDSGRVNIYAGGTWASLAVLEGSAPGENFGASVADVGDQNADGKPDIAIGVPCMGNGTLGRVEVRSGANFSILSVFTGTQLGEWFGYTVSAAGDLNNDGVTDIAVASIAFDGPAGVDAGKVTVFRGGSGVTIPTTLLQFDGEGAGDRIGIAMANVGDMDNDGIKDLVFGANRYDAPGTTINDNRGRAYLVGGGNGNLLRTWTGEEPKDWMGIGVASAGDIDGDGVSEILLGACQTEKGGAGRAYIVDGTNGNVRHAMRGEHASGISGNGDAFGFAVASVGDLDGDGACEFAVGAYGVDGFAGGNTGKLYTYSSAVRYINPNAAAPQHLDLRAVTWPTVGTDFTMKVTGAPANSVGLLGVSATRSDIALWGGTFYLDFASLTLAQFTTDGFGAAQFTTAIPSVVQLINLRGLVQIIVFDQAQISSVAWSNGMQIVLVP